PHKTRVADVQDELPLAPRRDEEALLAGVVHAVAVIPQALRRFPVWGLWKTVFPRLCLLVVRGRVGLPEWSQFEADGAASARIAQEGGFHPAERGHIHVADVHGPPPPAQQATEGGRAQRAVVRLLGGAGEETRRGQLQGRREAEP